MAGWLVRATGGLYTWALWRAAMKQGYDAERALTVATREVKAIPETLEGALTTDPYVFGRDTPIFTTKPTRDPALVAELLGSTVMSNQVGGGR